MEKDLNDSAVHNNSTYLRESESDKSFVGKVKSIISNTPLSKWFRRQDDSRPVIRRREEVFEDEDISEIQPPSKRVKLPDDEGKTCKNLLFSEANASTSSASNHIFSKVPEPVAGPSGLKSHRLSNSATSVLGNSTRCTFNSADLLNGHSDSEESTSGYSSVARIGSKEQVCGSQESSKQASPTQTSPSNTRSLFHKTSDRSNRTLFSDRSPSPSMNTSVSSRKPNFNPSLFGSPNFVDRTISTERILNSPFYNGKTTYGGASAYGRALGRSSLDLRRSLRNSVDIKPVNKTNESGKLVLGKTARRILDTIEQYSSPVNDAKKIPVVKRSRQDAMLTRYIGANPYIAREAKGPSTKELQVPTVPELLKMKARLQESTETVKQIAASSKSDLNVEYYEISTKEDEKEKHTGKMKTKISSVRQKCPSSEAIKEVNLPPVSLPITTLPKFDFVIPPPVSANSAASGQTQTQKTSPIFTLPKAQPVATPAQTEVHVQKEKRTTTTTVMEYKFSDPLVVAENIKSIVAINNFKFSEPPVCTRNKSETSKNVTVNFKMPDNKSPNLMPNKRMSDAGNGNVMKCGSVMDVLGKKKESSENESLLEKFKPVQGTWECSVCMIRNQPDKSKCVACEAPKAETKPTEKKNTLAAQFKTSCDKWECGSCMVYNKSTDSKCVCCTASKPTSVLEKKSTTVSAPSSFGDKFKPSSDTWECGTCMIRNKSESTKCVACETPNPKAKPANSFDKAATGQSLGFGAAFKVKADEWECGTCMVRNKASNAKCQCCETPNPKSSLSAGPALGTAQKTPISSFNFGIDKAAATSFSFGIPPTVAEASLKADKPVPSIFGGNSKNVTHTPLNVTFGIPASGQSNPKTDESSSTSAAAAESRKPDNETASVLPNSNPFSNSDAKLPAKTESAPVTFKFGGSSSTSLSATKEPSASDKSKSTSDQGDSNKLPFNLKPTLINGEVTGTLFASKPDAAAKATPAVTSAGTFTFGAKPAAVAAPLVPSTLPSQSDSTKTLFKFGSTGETSSFGSTSSSTTSLNNGIGSTGTLSFTPAFDKPGTNSTEVKPFGFGGSASQDNNEPASKVPMFSFGQNPATSAAAKPAGFNFGSTAAASPFNFSAGKTENPAFNAAPSGGSVFGATAGTAAQNGTFNFGMASNSNSQKAGFSFGAAVGNAQQAAQAGFNFGSPSSSFSSTSGGFNFSGATPAFNASAKPSFNFSDGPVTAFSAQPTDGNVATPRRIKRAVRRAQR